MTLSERSTDLHVRSGAAGEADTRRRLRGWSPSCELFGVTHSNCRPSLSPLSLLSVTATVTATGHCPMPTAQCPLPTAVLLNCPQNGTSGP